MLSCESNHHQGRNQNKQNFKPKLGNKTFGKVEILMTFSHKYSALALTPDRYSRKRCINITGIRKTMLLFERIASWINAMTFTYAIGIQFAVTVLSLLFNSLGIYCIRKRRGGNRNQHILLQVRHSAGRGLNILLFPAIFGARFSFPGCFSSNISCSQLFLDQDFRFQAVFRAVFLFPVVMIQQWNIIYIWRNFQVGWAIHLLRCFDDLSKINSNYTLLE